MEFALSQAIALGDTFEHRPSECGHCVQDFLADLDLRDLPGEAAGFELGTDGHPRALYTGVMSSETRVGPHGDPNQLRFIEHEIAYDCVAEDENAGTLVQVAISNNFFSMTGHFSPGGGHHALFGPEFTFKGTLASGNIIIEKGVDGQVPILTLTNTTDPARIPDARVGDGWRLDLSGATSNVDIYLKIWHKDPSGVVTDFGVTGPHNGRSDAQGMWSHSGSFDSDVIGTWWLKAVVGERDSTERSATIQFTVMSS